MVIKAIYQGQEVEVEIDGGTMYQVYCEQEHRFHISDVLERIGEYFDDNEVDEDTANEYIEKLSVDKELLNSVIERFKNHEGNDTSHCNRQGNLDEALSDIRNDIEDEFDIEIWV